MTWGLAWGRAAGVSEGSGDVFNRHLQEAFWDDSTSLHPPLIPALHFGSTPPLGAFQQISECWSLGTLSLSLWDQEIFQLFHVALVKPVQSSREGCGVFCTSMGFPIERQRGVCWLRARTTEYTGTLFFPLQWSSKKVSTRNPSLSVLFCAIDSKMLPQLQESVYQQHSQHVCIHYFLCYPINPMGI